MVWIVWLLFLGIFGFIILWVLYGFCYFFGERWGCFIGIEEEFVGFGWKFCDIFVWDFLVLMESVGKWNGFIDFYVLFRKRLGIKCG